MEFTDNDKRIKDSTTVQNNRLQFKGQLFENPVEAWIMGNFEGTLQYRSFWLGPGITSIIQKTKTLREAEVIGSPVNEQATALRKIEEPYEKEMEKLELKAEKLQKKDGNADEIVQLEQEYSIIEKKQEQAQRNYIRQFPDYLYSLTLLHTMSRTYGDDSTKALFTLLHDSLKQSNKGKDIQKYLSLSKKIEIGSLFADVTQPDSIGAMLTLSSKTGKWILLEFWASWCGPCRKENPELVKVFDTFKEKGFDIYAVSLDTDKDKWIEAIKKDKLPWWHVSDLRGSYNEAALTYSISGIPDNMLINPEGVIVARGLTPDQLKKYLEKELN